MPTNGWFFVGWMGDLTGPVTPATIAIDGNKTVTAAFEQDRCKGFAQHIVYAYGVQDEVQGLCRPDGSVAEIGLKSNSELVLDMGVGNEIVDDMGGDFYFYEFPNGPGIYLDHMEIAVAPDNGSGQPGNFTVVFIWGDDDLSNNGTVLPKYYLAGEASNQPILASDLHDDTGIGINIGRDDGMRYRFIRIRTYPASAKPSKDERAQVDAIERARFNMNSTSIPIASTTLLASCPACL